MKKISKTLLLIIFSFIFTLSVSAKNEVFNFDWETKETTKVAQNIITDKYMELQNGYIVTETDITDETFAEKPNMKITYYDYKGKEIKSNKLYNLLPVYTKVDGKNIYVIVVELTETDKIFKLIKLDENLKVVAEYSLPKVPEGESDPLPPCIIISAFANVEPLTIVDDKLNIIVSETEILQLDKDLKTTKIINFNEQNAEKYFEKLYKLAKATETTPEDSEKLYIPSDKKGTYEVFGGLKYCPDPNDETKTIPCASLLKLTNGTKEVFEKEYDYDNNIILSSRIIKDYIVAIRYTPIVKGRAAITDNVRSEIIILDFEGNIVQTINNNSVYFGIQENETGFLVNNFLEETTCPNPTPEPGSIMPIDGIPSAISDLGVDTTCLKTKIESYYIPLKVQTKVEGKGFIETVNNARRGEGVTFKVTPEKGYVLGEIKVTDNNGNVVYFTNNTFTMPTDDVLIEATFLPENPNTTDPAIILGVLLFFIGGISIAISYKKLKWLN